MFFSQAQEAESRGDHIEMAKNHRIALFLNLGAVVTYIVSWIIIVVSVTVRVIAIENSCYYDTVYYTYYC